MTYEPTKITVVAGEVNRSSPVDESNIIPWYTPVLSDSGAREVEDNGFTREPDADKPDLSWIFTVRGIELVPQEMIERIAAHFANGADKYEANNWRRGTSPDALARYRRSLARHVFAWFRDDDDEDHAAALAWNAFVFEINETKATEEWANPPSNHDGTPIQ